MRNHLVSLHRCFLSLLLACSTYITFYIQVWILRRFFSCPSHNLFFFFFISPYVQSVCIQSRNVAQNIGGWIKASVILGTSSSVSGGSWIFCSLVKSYRFYPLEGPLAETSFCTSPWDCVRVHLHARDGFTSLVVSLPHFLPSSLKLLWGLFCSMLMRFKIQSALLSKRHFPRMAVS